MHHSSLIARHGSRAFTLAEILIVITIIVLMMALAVPAFNAIRGSRSIEGAENQISALIGRSRADAIGVQKPHGVMFFLDTATDRFAVAVVRAAGYPDQALNPDRDVYLELEPDVDILQLPPGIMVQVLDNANAAGAASDRYMGFNKSAVTPAGAQAATNTPFGGVILFNADGRLINRSYGFVMTNAGGQLTPLGSLLMGAGYTGAEPVLVQPAFAGAAVGPPRSQLGMVLFDRESFEGQGFAAGDLDKGQTDPRAGGTTAATEPDEENWIDANSIPVIVNRYNGTLVRGE
jgi:type II secretory pathway pseudopilin PulG